jgi:TatD DNase family protein
MVTVIDPAENATTVFAQLPTWMSDAQALLDDWGVAGAVELPTVHAAIGVHPQHAELFQSAIQSIKEVGSRIGFEPGAPARASAEQRALEHTRSHPRTQTNTATHFPNDASDRGETVPPIVCLGEIGLDYHYEGMSDVDPDYEPSAPREVQKDVFRKQIKLAKQYDMPIALHVRDAHEDALSILKAEGLPKRGALLHCVTVNWDTLKPFIELGCMAAFGGALTFNRSDDICDAARHVPKDRLLTETDAPFMAPVPLRGIPCEPAQTIFTAACLAQQFGCANDVAFYDRLYDNAVGFFDIPAIDIKTVSSIM